MEPIFLKNAIFSILSIPSKIKNMLTKFKKLLTFSLFESETTCFGSYVGVKVLCQKIKNMLTEFENMLTF